MAGAVMGAAAWLGLIGASPAKMPARIGADHHLHLTSPQLAAAMKSACHLVNREMPCEDVSTVRTAGSALDFLDREGADKGVLLSGAYLFAWSGLNIKSDRIEALMHEENAFTVRQAEQSHGRLVPFIGVNAQGPEALREMAAWRADCRVRGIKLHVTNSGLDLLKPGDLDKLRRIFAEAARDRYAIVIHLRDRSPTYGAAQIANFLEKVMPAAGNMTVQIAHIGSWGDLDETAVRSLTAFADWMDRHPGTYPNLKFDLAALAPAKDEKSAGAVASQMRRLGISRFLPGSDWPALLGPGRYYAQLRKALPLTASEWASIERNEAPYLSHPRCEAGGRPLD
ncbi:MAG TPA: amidohydrolase family protein [Novosphingobium sp.]|nr:amidohydrolase family protein [Novosphingobium sp.]